jgi:hypothetical protein
MAVEHPVHQRHHLAARHRRAGHPLLEAKAETWLSFVIATTVASSGLLADQQAHFSRT